MDQDVVTIAPAFTIGLAGRPVPWFQADRVEGLAARLDPYPREYAVDADVRQRERVHERLGDRLDRERCSGLAGLVDRARRRRRVRGRTRSGRPSTAAGCSRRPLLGRRPRTPNGCPRASSRSDRRPRPDRSRVEIPLLQHRQVGDRGEQVLGPHRVELREERRVSSMRSSSTLERAVAVDRRVVRRADREVGRARCSSSSSARSCPRSRGRRARAPRARAGTCRTCSRRSAGTGRSSDARM